MEVEIDRDKLIDIWEEFAALHQNDVELHEFITEVDLGIDAFSFDEINVIYISLFVEKKQAEWLRENEILKVLKEGLTPLLANDFPGWDLKFCVSMFPVDAINSCKQ